VGQECAFMKNNSAQLKEVPADITVCAHCMEEIQRVGEDALDWCSDCQSIEGDTLQITTEEYERVHA
jgi:hypothetical protein